MDITIETRAGLGNRLRVLYSMVALCHRPWVNSLTFKWNANKEANGEYNECFQPPQLPWVHIDRNIDAKYMTNFHVINDIPSWVVHVFPFSDEVRRRANAIIDVIGTTDFLALHIRQTDRLKTNSTMKYKAPYLLMPRDDDFLSSPEGSTKPIFLATDNVETQRKFKKKYGQRCIINDSLTETNELRKGHLIDACVDMLVCSYAKEFKGTFRSSFSEMVRVIREAETNDIVSLDSDIYMSDACNKYQKDKDGNIVKRETNNPVFTFTYPLPPLPLESIQVQRIIIIGDASHPSWWRYPSSLSVHHVSAFPDTPYKEPTLYVDNRSGRYKLHMVPRLFYNYDTIIQSQTLSTSDVFITQGTFQPSWERITRMPHILCSTTNNERLPSCAVKIEGDQGPKRCYSSILWNCVYPYNADINPTDTSKYDILIIVQQRAFLPVYMHNGLLHKGQSHIFTFISSDGTYWTSDAVLDTNNKRTMPKINVDKSSVQKCLQTVSSNDYDAHDGVRPRTLLI